MGVFCPHVRAKRTTPTLALPRRGGGNEERAREHSKPSLFCIAVFTLITRISIAGEVGFSFFHESLGPLRQIMRVGDGAEASRF